MDLVDFLNRILFVFFSVSIKKPVLEEEKIKIGNEIWFNFGLKMET